MYVASKLLMLSLGAVTKHLRIVAASADSFSMHTRQNDRPNCLSYYYNAIVQRKGNPVNCKYVLDIVIFFLPHFMLRWMEEM